MNIKRLFTVPRHSTFGDSALLLLRLVAGLAFIFHGWGKIQNPMGWMGADADVPGVFQALAAVAEFGGGIAWMLGLLTPLACFGLLCTMAVAACMHAFVMHDPFVGSESHPRSFEPAAGYFCVALALWALGPGRFSADRAIFGARG